MQRITMTTRVEIMSEAKRIAFFLPNTFTALNMACGFAAIVLANDGEFFKACWVLCLGAVFDMVDGKVARLLNVQSSFGEQFDSLSDLISFGLAPAFIMYFRFFEGGGRIGLVITFLYILCGALRLARFNANIEKVDSHYFQGLPIPMSAIAMIGFIFVSLELPKDSIHPYLAMAYTAFYALLMISTIPFNSFKKSTFVKKHKKGALFLIFILLSLLFIYEQLMVVAFVTTYVLGSIFYFFLNRGKLDDVFTWQEEKGLEE